MIDELQFQYPWVLGFLALLPLYAILLGRTGRMAALDFPSAELVRTAGVRTRVSPGRLMMFLRLLVAACILIALSGPRLTNDRTEVLASGTDIMLVLDLSWSMIALDMGDPKDGENASRLYAAQQVMEDFIRRRPNDRIGLTVFSAVPYLACPPTLNHDWLIHILQRLHVGMIKELGTAIGDATASALSRLHALRNSRSRIIILITDGTNNRGELQPLPSAQLAAALKARIYTIGIGAEKPTRIPHFNHDTGKPILGPGGTIIPGQLIRPPDYEILEQMARYTRGKAYRADNRKKLESIYNEIDRLEKTEVRVRHYTTYTPLFQWPLSAGLMLLGIETMLANTRYRRIP